MHGLPTARLAGALFLGLVLARPAGAGSAIGYTGFSAGGAARQADLESRIGELADADQVARVARKLASRPHVAGTEAQARTRDFVIEEMTRHGLSTDVAEYEVFLPFPTRIELNRLEPDPRPLPLDEPALDRAPATAPELPFPPHHGYAAAGTAEGELVYVNYGREADLDELEAAGVSLEGKIALARYGRVYRGRKVQNVQKRGAIACIIYSDPQDDGYVSGDIYPDGPMRNGLGIQRGSVKFGAPGDPTTPGYASVAGADRVKPADSEVLPRIPSTPIGYQTASELMKYLAGPEVPSGWQGALPFRYHLGPGPVRARLRIERDDQYRKIWNTFGRIDGTDFPDEWIIVGAHRDAWCAGSADNVSGVSVVLEAARICGELARAGRRPRRTLIFATWDAEEWGIIGSNEWVEQHRELLRAHAVAYINQDMVVTGADFSASASPSLASVLTEVLKVSPHPDPDFGTVHDVWSSGDEPPEIGVPGGGSDHAPFFLHLGLPCAGYGFGGRQGIYHSRYDTPDWMERFGDPGYRRHRTNAIITAAFALRLANADVLPLDHARYAAMLVAELEELRPRFESTNLLTDYDTVWAAAQQFRDQAAVCGERIDSVDLQALTLSQSRSINDALRRVELVLTRTAGNQNAEGATDFYQNLVFGLVAGGGYRQQVLPGIHNALEQGYSGLISAETDLLADRLRQASSLLEMACEAMSPAAHD
jgi:N-acetylated-alpha-linked acidic dipeptidase